MSISSNGCLSMPAELQKLFPLSTDPNRERRRSAFTLLWRETCGPGDAHTERPSNIELRSLRAFDPVVADELT